jgi:phosphonate transport system substrate-binding protein
MEQTKGGKQIYKALENSTVKIQAIATALREQKDGSKDIMNYVLKIRDLPEENRKRSYIINSSLKKLRKDAELLITELGKFKVEKEDMDILKFGVVPLESPVEMYRRFLPLSDYLSKVLKRRVQVHVAVDFAEAIKDAGENVTVVNFMTPTTYIEAHKKYGVEVILKALNRGKPFHHSVIVVREGGKIERLEDLRGASFAFGDKFSTSSYLVPRAMLLEAGIDLKDLGFYANLGHHDDVAKAVLSGEFDAGGIMEATAEKYLKQGLRIIKRSPEIPEFNISVGRGLEEDIKKKVKQALMNLDQGNPESREILSSINPNYTGFVESSDSDFDSIRGLLKKLG